MAASHDARRDPWVALGALAVGDARAQYTAGLDPPQTASITSRAKVPRPLVSLHLRVQPARPGPPHTTSRPVAPPCAASTGSPPYTNRLGPRRADAARVPRRRRQRSNARAETIVAAPTAHGRELRYVRRGSAADDWLEHRPAARQRLHAREGPARRFFRLLAEDTCPGRHFPALWPARAPRRPRRRRATPSTRFGKNRGCL